MVRNDKGIYDDQVKIVYMSVYIEETDDYYVFRYTDTNHREVSVWLNAESPTQMNLAGTYTSLK